MSPISAWPRITALLLMALPIAACSQTMRLSAHISESNTSLSGTLKLNTTGDGSLRVQSASGLVCDGLVVPSTARTPERLEGQIQCNDGRSGAIRMTVSKRLGVGSGRLERETITFRAAIAETSGINAAQPSASKSTTSSQPAPAKPRRGSVTLQELAEDGLAGQ